MKEIIKEELKLYSQHIFNMGVNRENAAEF